MALHAWNLIVATSVKRAVTFWNLHHYLGLWPPARPCRRESAHKLRFTKARGYRRRAFLGASGNSSYHITHTPAPFCALALSTLPGKHRTHFGFAVVYRSVAPPAVCVANAVLPHGGSARVVFYVCQPACLQNRELPFDSAFLGAPIMPGMRSSVSG